MQKSLSWTLTALCVFVGACSSSDFEVGQSVNLDMDSDRPNDSDVAETYAPADVAQDTSIDTSVDASPDTDDTSAPDTGLPDTGFPDTGLPDTGATDTGAADTGAPDTMPADIGTDAIVSRCKGKGIATGQVGVVFLPPPDEYRPTGFLAFAGSVDSGSWKDPYPGCVASSAAATSLVCIFGGGAKFRFVVGVVISPDGGFALDPSRLFSKAPSGTFTALGEYIACKGEVEVGAYRADLGFTGKLTQWGSTEKFELIP